jgi:hypothetical protein
LFISQIFVRTVPVVIGAASAIYLATDRYSFEDRVDQLKLTGRTGQMLRLASMVGIAGMVLAATVTGGRTVPFYTVATFVGVIIFLQIFFLRDDKLEPTAVLVQILAFGLVVRAGALLWTPGLIGVDSWVHLTDYAQSIRQTGQLSAIAESKYVGAPLYHLLAVVSADAFGTTLRTAVYATLGLAMPLSALLVYYTTRLVLPVRWALFAVTAFSLSDHVVRWGIHIIPNSMGLVFFLAVVYGTVQLYAARESLAMYGFVLFYIIAVVLTHQVSTFITLVFLGAGGVGQLYTRFISPSHDNGSVNFVPITVVAVVITVANWHLSTPGSDSFLVGMVTKTLQAAQSAELFSLESTSSMTNEAVASLMTTTPTWVQLLDALGFLMFLFVALSGSFTLLRQERLELLPLNWNVATGAMLFVTLGMPLLGLYVFLPSRWYAFMYVPFVLMAAAGLRHLEVKMAARQFIAVTLVFTLLFTGPMLIDRKATMENPVNEDHHHRFAYSQSELDAARTISSIHPDGQSIHADDPYYLMLRDWQGMPATPQPMNARGDITGKYLVYRSYQAEGKTEVEFREETLNVPLSPGEVCKPSMDIVYTNGDVQYCRRNA